MTRIAVFAGREAGRLFQFRPQFRCCVVTSVAVDMVSKLVGQRLGRFLFTLGISRTWHRLAFGNVPILEMARPASRHLLAGRFENIHREYNVTLGR